MWGWGEPGVELTVTLTESRQEAVAAVGAEAMKREQPEAKAGHEPKPIVRIEYVHENAPEFTTVTRKAKAAAEIGRE